LARNPNLQLKILKELASTTTFGVYLRPTYSEVAKKLGIDEETVRLRVRQAKKDGSILGWQLAINPHVLGREATSVVLEVDDPSKKEQIIKQIKLIDEVVLLMDFYEKPLRVVFYHESDQDMERRLNLMKSICGDKNPVFWRLGYPSNDVKLKRTDWEILRALRRDSMSSNLEIAKEIGVSSRTVKRRLAFMTETSTVYSFVMGDVKRIPGMSYFILVNCANDKKKRLIDEQVAERLENTIFQDTFNKQYSVYVVVFPNMGEADEAYRWIKNMDGAEKTRMFVTREIISVPDWFDKEIDKHLKTE
jgi:DNA-binding Lrp family transcriptional regulator